MNANTDKRDSRTNDFSRLLVIALASAPLAIFGVLLALLSSDAGTDWAHSLFGTKHVLNFGGNPAEVLGHLLNWIVMTGCNAALCATILATGVLKGASGLQFWGRFVPGFVCVLTWALLLFWAGILDQRSGEGTVVMAFILFFGPTLTACAFAGMCLVRWSTIRKAQAWSLLGLFWLGVGFQCVYERSGTGGPNFFVLPTLILQVAAWWQVAIFMRRRAKLSN